MANAYVTLQTFKGTGAANIAGTAYDARLVGLIEAVSRHVDRFCGRQFHFVTEKRYFDGDGGDHLRTGDLIGLAALKEDNNDDGTFETTWATADYYLVPHNANPTAEWGGPYRAVRVSTLTGGTQDEFLQGIKNYELDGTWGWWKVTKDSGLNGTLTGATGTSLVLSSSASGTIEVGHTFLIENEQVYVPKQTITGTAVNVERAANGSTGTAHADKDVLIVQYPGAVVEAVVIQSVRLWKRRESGFASQVGFPETGQFTVFSGGLDPDVKELLAPYRRMAV